MEISDVDLEKVPLFAIASTGGIASQLIAGAFAQQRRWFDPEPHLASEIGHIYFEPPPFVGTGETTGIEGPRLSICALPSAHGSNPGFDGSNASCGVVCLIGACDGPSGSAKSGRSRCPTSAGSV